MTRAAGLVALVAVSAALFGACSHSSAEGSSSSTTNREAQGLSPSFDARSPGAIGWPATFLAVTSTPPVISHGKLIGYGVNELRVRSASTGAVRRVILKSLGIIDAVVTRDGSAIVAIDYHCRTSIELIGSDGKATPVRTVPGSAQEIAINPAGTELAYLTYPGPPSDQCSPTAQPKSPQPVRESAGLAQFLPSVLAIVNLSTGATTTTATENPGHPLSRASWSPDGDQLAVGYAGDPHEILVMPVSRLDFRTARRLSSPGICALSAPAWTTSGIVAVEGCGSPPDLSPGRLVQLNPAGQVTHAWSLPACIDGIGLYTDSSHTHVLVQAEIGYGVGNPCGIPLAGTNAVLVATTNGASLTTIARFPPTSSFNTTGW